MSFVYATIEEHHGIHDPGICAIAFFADVGSKRLDSYKFSNDVPTGGPIQEKLSGRILVAPTKGRYQMNEMKYALLTEVVGRWKADILENFLKTEDIDVVIVQETLTDLSHKYVLAC